MTETDQFSKLAGFYNFKEKNQKTHDHIIRSQKNLNAKIKKLDEHSQVQSKRLADKVVTKMLASMAEQSETSELIKKLISPHLKKAFQKVFAYSERSVGFDVQDGEIEIPESDFKKFGLKASVNIFNDFNVDLISNGHPFSISSQRIKENKNETLSFVYKIAMRVV